MKTRLALVIGGRTVLAMTCWKCGQLRDGGAFPRYRRNWKDLRPYIDRRCRACRWAHLEGDGTRTSHVA